LALCWARRCRACSRSHPARPAAVSRMTPTGNPAPRKVRSKRQYCARWMRPLAPNTNSNRPSMASRQHKCAEKPGAQGFAAIERRGTFGGYSRPGLRAEGGHTSYRCCVIYILPGIEWTYLKLLANYCQRQNANARLALPKPLSAANDSSKRLFRHDLSLI
jgi:hypothetical protein